jgi:hypothetical protein
MKKVAVSARYWNWGLRWMEEKTRCNACKFVAAAVM